MYIRWKLGIVFARLNLEGVSIPIFQRIHKTPNKGYSILLKFHLGMSPTKFIKKREFIAVGLKASDIELEQIKANIFRLKVRKGNLSQLPTRAETSVPLETIRMPKDISAIPFGVDLDGYEVALPLFNQDGGTTTLIGGNPGKGKTSALKVILSGLVESRVSITWFDPKNGSDANPYRSRVNVVASPLDPEPYIEKLRMFNACIANRNSIVGSGKSISMLPKVLIMIDEWAMLGTLGTKQQQQEFTNQLRRLVSTGRSSNFSVVLATQRPTSITIDVATRELSGNRIAFSVGDEHASEAILGVKGAESLVNPLRQGQALAWINGEISRISLFKVSTELASACDDNSGFNHSIEDLIQLEETYARELGIFPKN
jgi:hypothetical protein